MPKPTPSTERKKTSRKTCRKNLGLFETLKETGVIDEIWKYSQGINPTGGTTSAPVFYYNGWRDCIAYFEQLRNKNNIRASRRASKTRRAGDGRRVAE